MSKTKDQIRTYVSNLKNPKEELKKVLIWQEWSGKKTMGYDSERTPNKKINESIKDLSPQYIKKRIEWAYNSLLSHLMITMEFDIYVHAENKDERFEKGIKRYEILKKKLKRTGIDFRVFDDAFESTKKGEIETELANKEIMYKR